MALPELESASLQELIELRDQIARAMKRRFERSLALLFTDIVSSTRYVSEHGDVAGRLLLARHHVLLDRACEGTSARVVDRAGDGAFCIADSASDGAECLVRLQRLLLEENAGAGAERRLRLRCGLHFGPALVGEELVTGEAVHIAARIAATAGESEIRLSEPALRACGPELRECCRRVGAVTLKGLPGPTDLLQLDWRDFNLFAARVEVAETGAMFAIPCQARVSIGRGGRHSETLVNDIVLELPDEAAMQHLSRVHCELLMTPAGYELRAVGRARTRVDGKLLRQDEVVLLRPDSVAELSEVLTLRFLPPAGSTTRTLFDTAANYSQS